VLALQRSAGNRAVSRLVRSVARAPVVKGGVETKVVSPAVTELLDAKGIKYAREVTFELIDANGEALVRGRFDVVFRTPVTQELIFPELKGDMLSALTPNQEIYHPLFKQPGGARVRITSRVGGSLQLPTDAVEAVGTNNFLIVSTENLNEFAAFVEEAATGVRPTHFYYDRGKLRAFNSEAELHAALTEKGMVVTAAPPPKPPGAPAVNEPLKRPVPADKPSPNPLYDPPSKAAPRPSRADPTAGPPEGPMRKGPNLRPQPADDLAHKPWSGDTPPKASAPTLAESAPAVAEEATVVAERVGGAAAADLAEKAAATAAEGLTFAGTVGAVFEAISPYLDVLFLAEAGYALGKALIFHNPAELDPEQVKFMHLMDTNVMQPAFKALQSHEQEARKLALQAPELDVYAKVTMTIIHGARGAVSQDKSARMVYDDDELEDVQFNSVSVGYDSTTTRKDGGETHHYANWGDHRRRMQIVTFPILLNPLGQSRGLRRWVAMRANASHAIAHGLSARSIAEGTHWVGEHMGPGGYEWTYLDDREEARRKKAIAPSHRAEVELAAKIAFTEAYIDAASEHMDQPAGKKLYDDAVKYYDELKRTTIDPLDGPVTKRPQAAPLSAEAPLGAPHPAADCRFARAERAPLDAAEGARWSQSTVPGGRVAGHVRVGGVVRRGVSRSG
jgi:hypothetical protein